MQHQGRTEDALVAWTWKLYMTGEYPPEIVAYFPMVKATVRALDTIEDFAKKQFGYDVTSHLVAGASKRGWDTWLTGAVDSRITAIAPIVMDMLNFTQNVMHMYEAYGGWTFAFVVRRHALLLCIRWPFTVVTRCCVDFVVPRTTGTPTLP